MKLSATSENQEWGCAPKTCRPTFINSFIGAFEFVVSLIAQLVKNPPAVRRSRFDSWVRKIPGEGIGSSLQYSWASIVTQLVKNPPAMEETWVQSLGWEYPLEKEMAAHSSILAWQATVHGVAKSGTQLRDFTFTFQDFIKWRKYVICHHSIEKFQLMPKVSI